MDSSEGIRPLAAENSRYPISTPSYHPPSISRHRHRSGSISGRMDRQRPTESNALAAAVQLIDELEVDPVLFKVGFSVFVLGFALGPPF